MMGRLYIYIDMAGKGLEMKGEWCCGGRGVAWRGMAAFLA